MGGIVKETEKVDDQKLSNGNFLKNDKEKELLPQESSQNELPPQISSHEQKPTVENCCQGSTGMSCCKDETQEEILPSKETVTSCCKGANGISSCCNDVSEKELKKSSRSFTGWLGKWEQHEVLAAAGVIGAVATVGVAYTLYKRSR